MDPKSRRAATRVVLATVFIYSVGFGIVMPVLPSLIVELSGVTLSQAAGTGGWLLVTYAVFQFLFGPLVGNLGDRIGRRPLLLVSLAGFGIDYAMMGFAPTLAWLFLGRAIAGLFGAIYGPAYAVMSDIRSPEERAQGYGLVGAAFGTGFIVGPAIGGLGGELGLRIPFFIAGGLALANFVYAYFAFPETLPDENRRPLRLLRANPVGALLQLRKMPGVLPVALALFFWLVAANIYPATWAFFTSIRYDWSPGMVGASLAWTGTIAVGVQAFLTGRAVRRFGEPTTGMIGLMAGTTGFILFAAAPDGWMAFAIMPVMAFQAFVQASLVAMMSQRVPVNAQGELQGFNGSLTALASVVAPLVFNPTLEWFTGPDAPIFFAGAPFVIATAIGLTAIAALALSQRAATARTV